jgi:hypothetical protein
VGGFDGRARLASGSAPTASMTSYRVRVDGGALRLGPGDRDGVVLDVPLRHVSARPLGRAGSVVLDVDHSPLLLTFDDHQPPPGSAGAGHRVRRVVHAAQGRLHRERFLRALREARA